MLVMSRINRESQISVRSTPEARMAFDALVSRLRASGKLRYAGRKITQEAFASAVYLALEEMPLESLEAWLAPFVDRLDRSDGEDAPEAPSSIRIGVTNPRGPEVLEPLEPAPKKSPKRRSS